MKKLRSLGTMSLLVLLFYMGNNLGLMAHEIQHEIANSQSAVVVKIHYPDNTAFSFESYEISLVGQKIPVQVGRTDKNGRVAFLPDQAGLWKLKAFSDDGHGLEFTFSTDSTDSKFLLLDSPKSWFDRYARVFAGLGILLSFFGILAIFMRKK